MPVNQQTSEGMQARVKGVGEFHQNVGYSKPGLSLQSSEFRSAN